MAKRTNLRLVAVAILVILFGTGSAWAFSGAGSGVSGDPYVITTVEQLQEMQNDLAVCYVLGNDIDASATASWNGGAGFVPVGLEAEPFIGMFNGKGFVINNLFIYLPNLYGVGLFGYVGIAGVPDSGAEIINVGLDNVNITGLGFTGALIGYSSHSYVYKCWSTGDVRGTDSLQTGLGGLIGVTANANSRVFQCFSSANVTALSSGSPANRTGGLAGTNEYSSIIQDCYATGNVTAKTKSGGLVGDNTHGSLGGYVKRCYSTGKVIGSGGLIGYNYKSGITYDSYWDIQTSGKTSSSGGTGKITDHMMQQVTFVGWDFDDIWEIDEGQSYPYFIEPRVLVSLEIVGPDTVAENSQTQYKAIAHYDNNSTKDVTNSADWSVEPNDIAGISAGLLTTEMVDLPMDITITAQYTQGDITKEAQKGISIFTICPSGSALEFDGDEDYVEVPSNPTLGPTTATWSFWLKPTGDPAGSGSASNGTGCIMARGDTSGTWNGMHISLTPHGTYGSLVIQVKANSNPSVLVEDTVFLPTDINYNEWSHVTFVFDSGNHAELYVNGALAVNYTLGSFNFNNQVLRLATATDSYFYDFKGLMDDVRIYNRTLSAEEIQVLMHTRPDSDEPNLVAYWDFDEGQGQVAHDLAGDNDGQLGSTGEIDNSDPNWVDSDAPVGICTMEKLFERNINQAINLKLDILDILEEALGKETAGQYILEQFLNDGDSNIWKKRDILESKRMVRSAVQNEEKAEINIDQSINKLDDALDTLGIE